MGVDGDTGETLGTVREKPTVPGQTGDESLMKNEKARFETRFCIGERNRSYEINSVLFEIR